eukprot:7380496-Prymnesium_polylepis.1
MCSMWHVACAACACAACACVWMGTWARGHVGTGGAARGSEQSADAQQHRRLEGHLERLHLPISANQCQSVPISANQCQSGPIRANQGQSGPIRATQGHSGPIRA